MSIQSTGRVLEGVDFFKDLEPDDLDLVAGCGRNMAFEDGYYLFREREPADLFFVIRRGRVVLEKNVPGRDSLMVDTADHGEVVGASWLIPPYRCQFVGRASGQLRVVALDGACIRGKCDADTRLGYLFMKRLAEIL